MPVYRQAGQGTYHAPFWVVVVLKKWSGGVRDQFWGPEEDIRQELKVVKRTMARSGLDLKDWTFRVRMIDSTE